MTSYQGVLSIWPVQEAKAHFSEFLNACMSKGPQLVTKRGAEAAVLVSMPEWKRLSQTAQPSLKSLLLSETGQANLPLPSRNSARRRPVRPF